MNGSVPAASILCMAISCITAFALPILLFIYFRKKKKADILPFFTGCAVMLIFAFILESLIHRIILSSDAGKVIQAHLPLYALYGGFMAGLFEETGRFLAFRTVLRNRQDKDVNALMYGAGHGGFEAVVILGATMINNLIWSFMINSGNTAALTGSLTGDTLTQVETTIQALISSSPALYLLGGVERISAVLLHLSFSVLVWFAAKNKEALSLYPLAVLLHLAVDALTVILSGIGVPTILLEVIIAAAAVLTALFARSVWRVNGGDDL